nr:MAG TPA: hypothetical protein [Caudoviricetes sp.]
MINYKVIFVLKFTFKSKLSLYCTCIDWCTSYTYICIHIKYTISPKINH